MRRDRSHGERPEDILREIPGSIERNAPIDATKRFNTGALGRVTVGATDRNAITAKWPDAPPSPTDEYRTATTRMAPIMNGGLNPKVLIALAADLRMDRIESMSEIRYPDRLLGGFGYTSAACTAEL